MSARASSGNKLIFLDSDVVYEDSNWLDKCTMLDRYHVIQPFSVAVWRDPELAELQRYLRHRLYATAMITVGTPPDLVGG